MLVPILKKIGVKFSLNDPRWGRDAQNTKQNQDGKKPGDGPPDLDQLWRDFNQRLNRLFGNRRGGGDSGGGFTPNMRNTGVGIVVIAVIALLLWLASGFFIVQEGQTGIVLTFGKYSHTAAPGFNWRWPYPIQSHETVNVSQVNTVEVGYRSSVRNKLPKEALMLTEDENIIDIQFAVQYKLKNVSQWVFDNQDPREAIKQIAESVIREVVGRSKMDFVLYDGREKIAQEVGQSIQQLADRYKLGVQITNVTIQGVQPPEQVQAAFDDAVKARQDYERQKNEGQAYANKVIPEARGAASRLLQDAEAYRAKVVANAEGDTSRFKHVLTEYQKAPVVTRERMYLDTMQQIFANTTKVMVDAKNGKSLLYLPLDKLIAQTAAESSAAVKPNAPPAASANNAASNGTNNSSSASASSETTSQASGQQKDSRSDSRSREDRRDSRERETR